MSVMKKMGEKQAEAFINGLLTTLEQLISLKDKNGKYKDIEADDITKMLRENFGSLYQKAYDFWFKGTGTNIRDNNIQDDIDRLNARRRMIFNENGNLRENGYQKFLDTDFEIFYHSDFDDVKKLTPMALLGEKNDFDFLNNIYLGDHEFDLEELNKK